MSKRTSGTALVIGCVLSVLGAATDRAAAQRYSQPTRFELSAIGGGYFATDLWVGTNSSTRIHVGDSWLAGARLGINVNRQLGVDLGYGRSKSDLSTDPGTPLVQPGDKGTVTFDQFDFNFMFLQPSGPSTGFFTIGLGATVVTPTIPSSDASAETNFSWNIGIGMKYNAGKSAVLRVDARYRGMDTNHQTGTYSYCNIYGYCYAYASSMYYGGELTAGVGFRF
jgi:opacity protein-like surface antigen